jgi:hypothetical protein
LWSLVVVLVDQLLVHYPGLLVEEEVPVVLELVLDCLFLEVYQLLLVVVAQEI